MINFNIMKPFPDRGEMIQIALSSIVLCASIFLGGGSYNQAIEAVLLGVGLPFIYIKLYTQSYKAYYQAVTNHRYTLHTNRVLSDELAKNNLMLRKLQAEIRDMRNGNSVEFTERQFANMDAEEHENKILNKEAREEEDLYLQEKLNLTLR